MDDDFAFWERVHLIPFTISFVDRAVQSDRERPADKNLREKLLREDSGILGWLIRGSLQWQRQGLNPPQAVLEATAGYRRDEDLLADFIDECCNLGRYLEVGAKELYESFSIWFESNVSKKILSQKKFGSLMRRKFEHKRGSTGRVVYQGLDLR